MDFDLEMKTRDGVVLRADVMRPDISAKVPAILARTPYNKAMQFSMQSHLRPLTAAKAGYAYVIQDIRGRYASEGEWDVKDLTSANVDDGFDAVEWLASEPWCDGNVGMAGGSYVAETQLAAAMAQPPHLGCIAPSLMGIGKERTLAHGSLPLESMTIGWMSGLAVDRLMKLMPTGEADPTDFQRVLDALQRPDLAAATLPLNDLLTLASAGMPRYADTAEMVSNVVSLKGEQEKLFACPALWTTGWYDNAAGAEQFNTMRARFGDRSRPLGNTTDLRGLDSQLRALIRGRPRSRRAGLGRGRWRVTAPPPVLRSPPPRCRRRLRPGALLRDGRQRVA